MTGVALRYDFSGLKKADRQLSKLMRRAGDLTPLMDLIGASLVTSTQHRFETGRGPDGEPWQPSIRAKAQGGRTLVGRGHLRDSVTHEPTSDAVTVGSNLVYAAIHQLGGAVQARTDGYLTMKIPGVGWRRKKSVEIPARPFLGIDADDEAMIAEEVEDYLTEPLQ